MNEKAKKIADYAFKTIWWVAFITLFLLVFSIITAKMKGEVPKVFGYSIMNIVSGSMGEEIPAGSYILIKDTDPSDIKINDVICFYSDDPTIKGYPNTHRVVKEPIVNPDGSIEFVTRGDANLKDDDYTAQGDRLIGRYVKTLDVFGRFIRWFSGSGMMLVMIPLFLLSVGMMVYTAVIKAKSDASLEGEQPSVKKEDDKK